MGWSTSISWVDVDQNESHLATWHGSHLYGFRSADSDAWVGNLAEEAVISADYRNGFPDRYEVTVQGTVDGLKGSSLRRIVSALRPTTCTRMLMGWNASCVRSLRAHGCAS